MIVRMEIDWARFGLGGSSAVQDVHFIDGVARFVVHNTNPSIFMMLALQRGDPIPVIADYEPDTVTIIGVEKNANATRLELSIRLY